MTNMNITFVNVRVVEIDFKLNKDFNSNDKEIKVSLDFKIKNIFSEKDQILTTMLTAEIFKKEKTPPFTLKAIIEGIYKGEIKALKEFSKIHAPAHIFPYLRELISNITIRAGIPPLILPPINLHKVMESKNKKITQRN